MTEMTERVKATLKEELGDYVSPGKLERVGRKLSEMLDDGSSRDHAHTAGVALDQLRHYARRGQTIETCSSIEIVDRQFDYVRAILPYDYCFTSNAQQWTEAERICRALEGPMSALGVVQIASSAKPPLGDSSRDEP